MKTPRAKIRLYVEAALGEGQAVPVSREQANYLFNVMRLSLGDHVALFNGQPVLTQYTNSDRVRREKLQAHAMEAAEQCGGTYVPEIAEVSRLDKVLADWPPERRILFCDERMEAPSAAVALAQAGSGPWAILIGPEGGFSDAEAAQLRAMDCVTSVTLGPRVLRADTAAVAALTLWQATLGDWA